MDWYRVFDFSPHSAVHKKCTTMYIYKSCMYRNIFFKCKIRQTIYDVKWSLDCKLGLVHFLTFLNRSQRNQSDIFLVYFMYYTMLKPIVSKLLGVNLTMATIDWLVFFLYHQFIYKISTKKLICHGYFWKRKSLYQNSQ